MRHEDTIASVGGLNINVHIIYKEIYKASSHYHILRNNVAKFHNGSMDSLVRVTLVRNPYTTCMCTEWFYKILCKACLIPIPSLSYMLHFQRGKV